MRDIITSKAFYIPILIGTALYTLGLRLRNKYEWFQKDWVVDLYWFLTITTAITVEAFLLGKI